VRPRQERHEHRQVRERKQMSAIPFAGVMHRAARLLAVVVLVALSACATQVRTQVTRFNHMPAVANGDTFAVVPIKEQASSLEWEHYAELVAQQLASNGYARLPLSEVARAKYGVLFSYTIDRGRTVTTEVPVVNQIPGSTTTFSYGSNSGVAYTQPTYSVNWEPATATMFARELELEIFDTQQNWASQGHSPPIFQADARSAGVSGSLAPVMPAMIAAVFKDFPGKSGETISVSAPLQR
jgi:Domain of unknown function (DUF4136)